LLNNVIWCYLYDLFYVIAKPIFFFPLMGGASQSPIPFDSNATYFMVDLGIFLAAMMGLSVAMSLWYRFTQVRLYTGKGLAML
jgi:hypothetical protein